MSQGSFLPCGQPGRSVQAGPEVFGLSQLLRAEARELNRHRAAGGSDDYIKRRAEVVNKLYGPGARDAIRELMKQMKDEDATSREG